MMNEENKAIGILVLCGTLMSIVILTTVHERETSQTRLNEPKQVFIWNDDIESVPNQGYIKIDTIVNDTIYLSPDE